MTERDGRRIGSVAEIWRYPVQSLRGERLREIDVTETGIVGDRAYAVADRSEGKVVSSSSGKRRYRALITASAQLFPAATPDGDPGPVEIALADGTRLHSDGDAIDARLADAMGFDAALARNDDATRTAKEGSATLTDGAPAVRTYGHAPVHLLTTATLNALHAAYPDGDFAPARFRPNLVIDTGATSGFLENDWIGRTLTIGDALRLGALEHCPRCVMTVLAQGELPQDPGILETARAHNHANVGLYARVLRPGILREGDAVHLIG